MSGNSYHSDHSNDSNDSFDESFYESLSEIPDHQFSDIHYSHHFLDVYHDVHYMYNCNHASNLIDEIESMSVSDFRQWMQNEHAKWTRLYEYCLPKYQDVKYLEMFQEFKKLDGSNTCLDFWLWVFRHYRNRLTPPH